MFLRQNTKTGSPETLKEHLLKLVRYGTAQFEQFIIYHIEGSSEKVNIKIFFKQMKKIVESYFLIRKYQKHLDTDENEKLRYFAHKCFVKETLTPFGSALFNVLIIVNR